MQPKHFLLLSFLRDNSREKLTTISRKTGIPISTLFDLLKELNNNEITKSTVLLDFPKLGYHIHAQVFIKVNKDDKLKLEKHLYHHSNVNTIYKVNNGWDFIMETVHKNIKDLDGFLENIEDKFNLEKKETHYLINEIKKESFCISN